MSIFSLCGRSVAFVEIISNTLIVFKDEDSEHKQENFIFCNVGTAVEFHQLNKKVRFIMKKPFTTSPF